jgi:hypothetical protein
MIGAAAAAFFGAVAAIHPLDLTAFFIGRTHADNDIKIVFHSNHKLIVDSVGHAEGKDFVLVDTVREEGKPVRTRVWRTHPIGPGHFTGTLSDATGPVDIAVSGDTATIRYTMRDGGLKIMQQLRLQGDGRTLTNHVIARKYGIKFATVDGAIRKLD